jgi:predicted nucleic-acid-binding protein
MRLSRRKPAGVMRAVDTDVIVRFLTGDDKAQAERARQVIGCEPVFVPRTVLLEVEWVLRAAYDLPSSRIIPALRGLAGLPGVSVEDAPIVAQAMRWAEDGYDFADALHLAAASACRRFLTFDKRLTRSAARAGAIPVAVP